MWSNRVNPWQTELRLKGGRSRVGRLWGNHAVLGHQTGQVGEYPILQPQGYTTHNYKADLLLLFSWLKFCVSLLNFGRGEVSRGGF